MDLQDPPHRLCIYCRALEPAVEPCPMLNSPYQTSSRNTTSTSSTPRPVSGLTVEEDELIRSLQRKPSSLCDRCSNYNVINAFTKSEPLDEIQRAKVDPTQYIEDMAQYRLSLGRISSVVLTPSCQLCRLLYCILPRNLESDELHTHIEPYRSHIRQEGWEVFPSHIKPQCAIFLGLATSRSPFAPISDPFRSGDANIRFPMMVGPAICLETQCTPTGRNMNNAKQLDSMLDLSILVKPLEHCQRNHGSHCHAEKPPELLKIRMIDVVERKVVPCPPGCDYIALSYVWGGVQPTPGALERKWLPQTIEDAITVTKALGRRYLWVDALCIDQSPNPTAAQLQEKMEQLNMMATIYGCATLTIVALTGKDSNAGLPGISVLRPTQVEETIDGYTLFTIPQHISSDREMSTWSTRAWTLQEELLSRRLLQFTESEVHFTCGLGSVWEGMDNLAVKDHFPQHPAYSMIQMVTHPQPQIKGRTADAQVSLEGRMRLFAGLLEGYTSRRMTNDEDSLNALLGLLVGFKRQLFPHGFVHGLPLRSHPSSLGWIHDRNAKTRRRPMFPSWSWAGWQGTVLIPRDILYTFDGGANSTADLDLELHIVTTNGNELAVEGWVADIDICTEPFSEVFVPKQEKSIAAVMEGNYLHNNTLPTGRYSCLVVQRQCERNSNRNPPRQKVFMIVLERMGQVAHRRTMITMTMFAGHDFMQTRPENQTVLLI